MLYTVGKGMAYRLVAQVSPCLLLLLHMSGKEAARRVVRASEGTEMLGGNHNTGLSVGEWKVDGGLWKIVNLDSAFVLRFRVNSISDSRANLDAHEDSVVFGQRLPAGGYTGLTFKYEQVKMGWWSWEWGYHHKGQLCTVGGICLTEIFMKANQQKVKLYGSLRGVTSWVESGHRVSRETSRVSSHSLLEQKQQQVKTRYFESVPQTVIDAIEVDLEAMAKDPAVLPTATAQYNHRMTGEYNLQTRVKWAGIEIAESGGGKCTGQCLFNSTNLATTIADKKAVIANNFKAYVENIKAIQEKGVNPWCADWSLGARKFNIGRKLTIPFEDKPESESFWCDKLYNYDPEGKSRKDCDGKYIVTYNFKALHDKMTTNFPTAYDEAIQQDCAMLLNKLLGHWEEASGSAWTEDSEDFGSQSMYLIEDKVGNSEYNGQEQASFGLFEKAGASISHKLKIVGISQDGSKAKGPLDADLCWTVGITFPSEVGGGLVVQRYNSPSEAGRGSAVMKLMMQEPDFN